MSGSNLQGRWVASSIKEEDIVRLREVGYLTADIQHKLPTPGQVIPTPEPNESEGGCSGNSSGAVDSGEVGAATVRRRTTWLNWLGYGRLGLSFSC